MYILVNNEEMKRVALYQIVWLVIFLTLMYSCVFKKHEIVRDENGNIILKCNLENGVRHGKCFEYFSNGNVKGVYSWIAGVWDGEAIEYFENGNVKSTSMWKDNQQDGEFIWYYENGNIESKALYVNGQIIEQEFYDEEGRLIKRGFYIILNRQSKLNGLLVFASHDTDGNPDKLNFQESAFAAIFADKDTVDYGGFVEYEIEWVCSTEHYAAAFTGIYDHNFNVVDTSTLKEVDLESKNRFYPTNFGTDTLRIIFDFMKIEDGKEKIFTSYLEKVFTVIEKNE